MKTKLRLIIEVEYETNETPVQTLKDDLRQCFEAVTEDIVNFQDEHTAEALGFVCRIEEGEPITDRLATSLSELLADLNDAGEDEHPDTGEAYNTAVKAREVLAEARKLQD